MNSVTHQTCPTRNAPDTLGLAIARDMQERLRPAEIILQGSRRRGDEPSWAAYSSTPARTDPA